MLPRPLLLSLPALLAACAGGVSAQNPGDDTVDEDGDGYTLDEDCDDANDAINPGATEVCDGVDNDCDGAVDAQDDSLADGLELFEDRDKDGYGNAATKVTACEAGEGAVDNGDDCDDTKAEVNPGMNEDCGTSFDDNCDGDKYDEDADDCVVFYPDGDGDGHGGEDGICTCVGNPDYPEFSDDDCDDADGTVNPDAEEICNDGIDNDCDGSAGACQWQGDVDMELSYSGRIIGTAADSRLGTTTWPAGDLNDDGFVDILVFAPGGSSGVGSAGVFYGPLEGEQTMAAADGRANGTVTSPIEYAVPGGDLDGDGHEDVLLGSTTANATAGAVWLWSSPGGATESVDSMTISVYGGTSDLSGIPAGVGDLNGDGQDDFIVSSTWKERVYLIEGPWTSSGTVESLAHTLRNATGGVTAMAGKGDTNGDGMADLALGSVSSNSTGEVWVVYGPGTSIDRMSDANAILDGINAEDEFGAAVSWVGDLDGDGYDELLVGAPEIDLEYASQGQAYLFQGPVTGSIDAASAFASFDGEGSGDDAGATVTGGGDINGDGNLDLAFAAPNNDQADFAAGLTYIMYGPITSGNYDLKFADAFFEPEVQSRQNSGSGLWIGTDFNNDGIDDVLIGSPGNDSNGDSAGAADLFLSSGM